jgi:lipid-binding SYLF domain-containing protein
VNQSWLHSFRGWVYGLAFGAQLGVGVATVVVTAGVYVTLVAEAVAPTITAGAAIGVAFGAVRGASVAAAARIDSPASLALFHRRFARLERPAWMLAAAAQGLVVVAGLLTL